MEEKRHYSVIENYNRKLTIKYKNNVIAETTNALILKEVGKGVYDPVFYLPKEDILIKLELTNLLKSCSFCTRIEVRYPIKSFVTSS